MNYLARVRVFALVSLALSSFILLVPGALKWLFHSWSDLMTLLSYGAIFCSMVTLIGSVICPERMLEEAYLRVNALERVEVGTVTCFECCGCGHGSRRAWVRGDYIGKVIGKCFWCGSDYRVRDIYDLE
nr:hypothetical protein [Candidatus Njordarchaeota archaeon]